MILYHCTTTNKIERYEATGCILPPVRGWRYLDAARAWQARTGRDVLLRIEVTEAYPLPDHKPRGAAYWSPDIVRAWDVAA